MASLAGHDRFCLVLEGHPELVPCRTFAVVGLHAVDLFTCEIEQRTRAMKSFYLIKSGISELENIDHSDYFACFTHYRKIQVVTIVHLSQCCLNTHIHGRKIW